MRYNSFSPLLSKNIYLSLRNRSTWLTQVIKLKLLFQLLARASVSVWEVLCATWLTDVYVCCNDPMDLKLTRTLVVYVHGDMVIDRYPCLPGDDQVVLLWSGKSNCTQKLCGFIQAEVSETPIMVQVMLRKMSRKFSKRRKIQTRMYTDTITATIQKRITDTKVSKQRSPKTPTMQWLSRCLGSPPRWDKTYHRVQFEINKCW